MTKMFRDWYAERHGPWPGTWGENRDVVLRRVMEAMADWCDVLAAGDDDAPTPSDVMQAYRNGQRDGEEKTSHGGPDTGGLDFSEDKT